jgi:putative MATE family efflux protein
MQLANRVRSRHVWQLAWPNIISTLMLTSIGIAHIKLVAHYGADAVAAVSAGHRVYFLIQALMIGLSVATTALVARYWGSGNQAAAASAARASINLAMVLAIVAGVLFFVFAHSIALAFGLESEPAELAARFIRIMAAFNMAYALSMTLSTAVRATGDVQTPMRYSVVATAINIGLCLVFINGWGFWPEMGTAGAALAGGIAPLLVYSTLALRWFKGKLELPYARSGKPDSTATSAGTRGNKENTNYRELMLIGTPAALEQCIIQLSLILFMALVSHYGTAAFAAYAIGVTLLSAVIVVGYGFSIAGATLVAQYLGAGNPEQAERSAMRTLKLTLIAMTALGAICFIFARELSGFMVDDPDVIAASVPFMWVLSLVMPLMAVEVALAGALRGAGDTRTPLAATFTGLSTRLLGGLVVVMLDGPLNLLFAMLFADYLAKVVILVVKFRTKSWLQVATLKAPQSLSE